MHVDRGEAGAVEGGGHFDLAVDALLAENGDARAGDVEEGAEILSAGSKGNVTCEAGAVRVVEEGELLRSAQAGLSRRDWMRKLISDQIFCRVDAGVSIDEPVIEIVVVE